MSDEEEAPSLPVDRINNEEFKDRLLSLIATLRGGSVISLEGDWGRGKTDLLDRLERDHEGESLRVNPWHDPGSLLIEVAAKLQALKGDLDPDLLKRVEKLVSTGKLLSRVAVLGAVSFGAAALLPAALAVEKTGSSALDTIRNLVKSKSEQIDEDPNKLFVDLVDGIVGDSKKPFLVLVDDLDRCTPPVQVQRLEELHRLTEGKPNVVFIVALDSSVLADALKGEYGPHFKGHLYLDKIFTLRLNMGQLAGEQLEELQSIHINELNQYVRDLHPGREPIRLRRSNEVFAAIGRLATPRLLHNVFVKAKLVFDRERRDDKLDNVVLAWLVLSQAFPERRRQFWDIHSRRRHNSPDPFDEFRKSIEEATPEKTLTTLIYDWFGEILASERDLNRRTVARNQSEEWRLELYWRVETILRQANL